MDTSDTDPTPVRRESDANDVIGEIANHRFPHLLLLPDLVLAGHDRVALLDLLQGAHLASIPLGMRLPGKLAFQNALALTLSLDEDLRQHRGRLSTDHVEVSESFQTGPTETIQMRLAHIGVPTLRGVGHHAPHKELDDILDSLTSAWDQIDQTNESQSESDLWSEWDEIDLLFD